MKYFDRLLSRFKTLANTLIAEAIHLTIDGTFRESFVARKPHDYSMTNKLSIRETWTANTNLKVLARTGPNPHELGISNSGATCPDILTVEEDNYLVIGTDVTEAYRNRIPKDAGCGNHERIVMIPGATLRAINGHVVQPERN